MALPMAAGRSFGRVVAAAGHLGQGWAHALPPFDASCVSGVHNSGSYIDFMANSMQNKMPEKVKAK